MASDQGEKIVFLARELLNAGMQEDPAPKAQKTHITMSFKTLCLTTILAAAGGCGVATMAARANERPLNRYEKTEIDALLFYAA
ncbi:MAG: hypothetical protein KGI97_08410, partial [Alphaproteobacteria bacterium]|nr:hypothetical protein [Alphaproteobacteria bacterium]